MVAKMSLSLALMALIALLSPAGAQGRRGIGKGNGNGGDGRALSCPAAGGDACPAFTSACYSVDTSNGQVNLLFMASGSSCAAR